MFFCKPCQVKKNWPQSFSQSYGQCEVCGTHSQCFDVPSSALPEPPKPPQTWTLPPEPGPEVTHVKDRYRDVWRRGNGVWVHRNSVGNEAIWPWHVLFEKAYPLTDVSTEYSIDRQLTGDVE